MKKLRGLPTALAERLDLPPEAEGGAKITMWKNGRLLAEGVCGLLELSDDVIGLAVKGGRIEVRGSELYIKVMNADELIIEGRIASVEWG